MIIREASIYDCKDLFEWRNDALTMSMSLDSTPILYENHKKWFTKSLLLKSRYIYIGELNEKKVGVCRFDILDAKIISEVSINLNSHFRGQGVSFELLEGAIKKFKASHSLDILAKIKRVNKASLKIFKKSGFHQRTLFEDEIELILPENTLKFKSITNDDTDDLYNLLKIRSHSISHTTMPTIDDHKEFVMNNPYVHWLKVSHINKPIGTVYISENNSVGINVIESYSLPIYISQILDFLTSSFKPKQEKKSLIPEYFYINTSSDNLKLIEIYNALSLEKIQVSHKIIC